MQLNRVSVFAAGAISALLLGGGTAYAANGGTFLLGRANAATATTTLTNSAGTPLKLNAKAGYAPLVVNSSKTVTNLSADRLDGLSSASFLRSTGKAADAEKVDGINGASLALTTGRTGVITGSATDADGLASTAWCPAGTVSTGGGGFVVDQGTVDYSGPDYQMSGTLIPNSWYFGAFDPATGQGVPTVGYVVCYNPRGAVLGASATLPQSGAAAAMASKAR
jgi:hypothetical protein